MTRTVRQLIRVLERAAAQAPRGDLTDVVVESAYIGSASRALFSIPGEGETSVGARFEPDLVLVVIETEEID